MRTFTDPEGRSWQAALLDASYGTILLVFSPMHDAQLRQRTMETATLAEAMTLLESLDVEALREQLAAAEPWDPAAG